MEILTYKIELAAPKEKVRHTILDLKTYEQWAGAFYAGSTYRSIMDKGSNIHSV